MSTRPPLHKSSARSATMTRQLRPRSSLGTMFTYQLRVRYSECDSLAVVFNANYLAYCDHAMDEFLLAALGDDRDFQTMVKAASLEWHAPLRYREFVDITCEVTRWGTTSMDVRFIMTVDGQPRSQATITYVCVDTSAEPVRPTEITSEIRSAFANV